MKHHSIRITFACFIAGLTLMLGSAYGAEPAPSEKTGLKVGKKAPDWNLKDQHGKPQKLSSFLEKGLSS